MPSSRIANRESPVSAQSPLEECLIRLQTAVEQNRRHALHIDGVFTAWERSWSDRREQITQRLEFIESQLEGLVAEPVDTPPRLSVVGLPSDVDEGEAFHR